MEFLIIAADQSQRAAQFHHYLKSHGHSSRRIAPGQRIPAAKECWLGAVCFDGGASMAAEVSESLRYLSIPLAILAAGPAEARAAGVGWICEPATSDAQLLHELQVRCPIHPLAPGLRQEVAAPLVTAVEQTLSQMAGAEVTVRSTYQRDQPAVLGDLSVTLSLTRGLEGLLMLSFSMGTAEGLARRILADAAEALDPGMVKDCVGEIANIIAGQAKALFHGTPHHFVFSTPTVTMGQEEMIFPKGMTGLVIAFDCEQGPFALQWCRGG